MFGQMEKMWQRLTYLGSLLLDSWWLLLALMLMFALNRYAVSWIENEKKELGIRLTQIQEESLSLAGKIEQMQSQLDAASDLRFQEMMLMQKLLIVPDNHEMVLWEPPVEGR